MGVGHGDGDVDGGGVGGLLADRVVRLSSFSWSYWCAIYIFATEDKPMTHIYSNPQALTPTHGACAFSIASRIRRYENTIPNCKPSPLYQQPLDSLIRLKN